MHGFRPVEHFNRRRMQVRCGWKHVVADRPRVSSVFGLSQVVTFLMLMIQNQNFYDQFSREV
jgi:hypothetical protein